MTQNIFDLVDVWNDAAVTFNAIKMNVTDTASDAESLLMDLQVGGVSQMSVSKGSRLRVGADGSGLAASNGPGVAFWTGGSNRHTMTSAMYNASSAASVGWAASFQPTNTNQDLSLFRDGAADTLAQRRATNAQTFRLYNTWSNASNYERLSIGWDTNVVSIKPENAGTGSARDLHISGLPTSNPGPGILWNNAGTPAIGT